MSPLSLARLTGCVITCGVHPSTTRSLCQCVQQPGAAFQPGSERQAQSQGELHACLLPVSGFESVVQPSHPSVRSEQELCEADHTVRSFEGSPQDSNKNYVQVPWTAAQCQVPLLPAQERHCCSRGGQTQRADRQARQQKVQLELPAKARCADRREAVTSLSKRCLEFSFSARLHSPLGTADKPKLFPDL